MLLPSRPFGSWVGLYEEKAGIYFGLEPQEEIIFHRDHGFVTWMMGKDYLHILKMAGNSCFWKPVLYEMLEKVCLAGWKGIMCTTRRDPKAFIRIFGGQIDKQEGGVYYITINLENANFRRDTHGRRG